MIWGSRLAYRVIAVVGECLSPAIFRGARDANPGTTRLDPLSQALT